MKNILITICFIVVSLTAFGQVFKGPIKTNDIACITEDNNTYMYVEGLLEGKYNFYFKGSYCQMITRNAATTSQVKLSNADAALKIKNSLYKIPLKAFYGDLPSAYYIQNDTLVLTFHQFTVDGSGTIYYLLLDMAKNGKLYSFITFSEKEISGEDVIARYRQAKGTEAIQLASKI